MLTTIKRIILTIRFFPDRVYNYFIIYYKRISYETYPAISGKLFVGGSGKIILGKKVFINSNLFSNPIGGDTKTIFSVANDATLKIGNHSGLSNVAISCKAGVFIGDYVKIGGGVKIYDSDFHSLHYEKRKNIETDKPLKKSITIKNGCFIGAHSIILKGVTIGENSIIGAGSVVTKSVPDGEIWAGNPIKFIKKCPTGK